MTSGYEMLADEYYDASAHPTCYNFNRLSRAYLERGIPEPWIDRDVLEVGAGNSCAAAILHARGYSLNGLEITDASSRMLAHSEGWRRFGASLTICDARSIKRSDASVGLLIASLADPYNDPAFWAEIQRVVRPGGTVLVTIPSFQWAARFRATHGDVEVISEAEFILRDGRLISVPSFILPLYEQVQVMEDAGLMIVQFESLGANSLPSDSHSAKVDVFASDLSSLVWGFKMVRLQRTLAPRRRQCL